MSAKTEEPQSPSSADEQPQSLSFISHNPGRQQPTGLAKDARELSQADELHYARRKRRRTSPYELSVLEDEFRKNSKPSKIDREQIAQRVGMCEKNVQIWFQNKRQQSRRSKSDAARREPSDGISMASRLSAYNSSSQGSARTASLDYSSPPSSQDLSDTSHSFTGSSLPQLPSIQSFDSEGSSQKPQAQPGSQSQTQTQTQTQNHSQAQRRSSFLTQDNSGVASIAFDATPARKHQSVSFVTPLTSISYVEKTSLINTPSLLPPIHSLPTPRSTPQHSLEMPNDENHNSSGPGAAVSASRSKSVRMEMSADGAAELVVREPLRALKENTMPPPRFSLATGGHSSPGLGAQPASRFISLPSPRELEQREAECARQLLCLRASN